MTKWEDCKHEWATDTADWTAVDREYLVCIKCKCPAEKDLKTGQIFWPAT